MDATARLSIWLATPLLVLGCAGGEGGSTTAPPPVASTGALEISASTTGEDIDPDGYELTIVSGGLTRTEILGREPGEGVRPKAQDTFTWPRVSAGEYEIELADVAGNCRLAGSDTRTLTVTAGRTASTTFEIACDAFSRLIDKILFESWRDGPFSIYHMNPDGSEVTRLTFPPDGEDGAAHPSPDGKRIAFVRFVVDADGTGHRDIFIVHADGGEEYRLVENAVHPSWSPDGKQIAYNGWGGGPASFDVRVMDADGTNRQVLTTDPAIDAAPRWSPDGSQIVFESQKDDPDWFDIWVMNVDGTGLRRVTTNGWSRKPRWSPDGTRITFDVIEDVHWNVYVVNVDGSGFAQLTTHPADDLAGPWAPDGTRMLISTRRDVDADGSGSWEEIYAMNPDGTGLVRLTDDPAANVANAWAR